MYIVYMYTAQVLPKFHPSSSQVPSQSIPNRPRASQTVPERPDALQSVPERLRASQSAP